MPLGPGDTAGKFVIVSLLGKGGMGEVYLARDPQLQRSVALKVLYGKDAAGTSATSTDGAARMLREARAAAALDHPNVVSIFEVGEVVIDGERSAFLAMELVRGHPLRAFVGEEDIALPTRVRWLADTARALAAAHRIGLVHRDVKPENVMIRDDGVVKVLDFGIAKRSPVGNKDVSGTSSTEAQILPSFTTSGMAVGTPYYMAPEQMRNEQLDGRADQFAWGVVAYELLSGKPPWGKIVDALELVSNILSKDPTPIGDVVPGLPTSVATSVMRALSKRRDDRFVTMDDVVRGLEGHAEALARTDPHIPLATARSRAANAPTEALRVAELQKAKPSSRPPPPLPIARKSSRRALYAVASVAVVGLGVAGVAKLRASSATNAAGPSIVASSSAPAQANECTTNAECVRAKGGAASVCRKTHCVPLASEDCRVLSEKEDLLDDRTIWVGAMFPLTGEDADRHGTSNLNAVELARRDFASTLASVRRAPGGPRPIAIVACDDATDARRAARHLVDDVDVPAVIGFQTSAEVVDLANSLFVPRGIMTIAALNMSPIITSIPHAADQPRLVWRTTYSTSQTAQALATFVPGVLAAQRNTAGATAPMRVATVRPKDATGVGFSEQLFRVLEFNGRSAVLNGAAYHEIAYAELEGSAGDAAYAAIVDELLRFRPHVIIHLLAPTFVTKVIAPLEARWPRSEPRPRYASIATFNEPLLKLIGNDADRRHRFFGMTTVSSTANNARFVVHYNETFDDKITRTQSPNSSYDAFYLVAYASLALDAEAVSGAALSRAVKRLVPPGRPTDVGATSILDGFSVLRRGQSIDLVGATGGLDFDLTTGEAPVDQAIVCAHSDERGYADDSMESGLVFNSTKRALEGSLRCP